MNLVPLVNIMIEPLVRAALLEDLGRAGDLTTDAIVPVGLATTTTLSARGSGILAGLDLAKLAFLLIDRDIELTTNFVDGSDISPGQIIGTIRGPARGILTAERTALNFLNHLSGIATATKSLVTAVGDCKARIVCTRKTTPGLRSVEKYAVRAGGGSNHRFGLDDAVLIKDNHVAIAGGIKEAIECARSSVGHLVKIEVEVDTLTQLNEALMCRVDAVLLDNMTLEEIQEAVAMVSGRAITEASGRVNSSTVAAIAAKGVDLISCGSITHSAPALDVGLDFQA